MKRSEIILMVIQVPIDFLLLILAGISAYYLRFAGWVVVLRPIIFSLSLVDFLNIAGLVAVVWILIFAVFGLYSTNPNRKLSRDLVKVVLACSVGLGVIALYVMFTLMQFDSRFLVVVGWLLAIIYIIVGRLLMRGIKSLLYRSGLGLRRVVVIGSGKLTDDIVGVLKVRKELGYKVIGQYAKFDTSLVNKLDVLQLDEIIFTNPRSDEGEAVGLMDYCADRHNIVLKYSADLFATYSANMVVSTLAGVPIVELRRTPLDGWGRVVKRFFDIVMSLIVIILASSIMLISAIIIFFETGRPIIYKNERLGIRGRKFFTFKLRSMYQKDCTGIQFGESGESAEKKEEKLIVKQSIKDGPIYKIANDPRVTPFGRFIRRWSIDELPQFFNVLGGSMSIVGPRPHQPREVAKYQKRHRKVFTLKPGITGMAQISGRSDLEFEDEVKLDIFYIEKWSIFLDLIVFIKTPFVVLKRKGAL